MIRYRCPRCKKSLTAGDGDGGAKLNCPHCEQRLQVPVPPPPNKTVLGALDDSPNRTVLGDPESPAPLPRWMDYADQPPPIRRAALVDKLPPAEPVDDLEEVADDRPRRRPRRDDDYDDRAPRRRRRSSPCPRCGCTAYPRQASKLGPAAIVCIIVGVFFWPLLIVAIFLQEKWEVCQDCGEKLRQIGTGI